MKVEGLTPNSVSWTSHQFIVGLTYRDEQPSTLMLTQSDQLTPSLHVFAPWEETGENSRRHSKNMQTPHNNTLTQNRTQDLLLTTTLVMVM